MAYNVKKVQRWTRSVDESVLGDAVEVYTKTDAEYRVEILPAPDSRVITDAGIVHSETRYKIVASYIHDFEVGDRISLVGEEDPRFEVVTAMDFALYQMLEVRPLG